MKKSIRVIISIFVYILILSIGNTVTATEITTSSGKKELKIGETIELEFAIQPKIDTETGYINSSITDWTISSDNIKFIGETKQKSKVTIEGVKARNVKSYRKIYNSNCYYTYLSEWREKAIS